jgi:hypothetical protein
MSERFPHQNEEPEETEQPDVLNELPQEEVFRGLGEINQDELRDLIKKARSEGFDNNPQ